ncbi:hypothetical protein ABK040_000173 [Willaertia magna]
MDVLPDEMLFHIFSFAISSFENIEILNYLLINKSLFNFLEEHLDKVYFKESIFNKFLFFCRWDEILQLLQKNFTETASNLTKTFYYPLPFSYRILYFKLNNFWKNKKQYCLQNKIYPIRHLPCKNFTISASIFGDCNVGKRSFCKILLKDESYNNMITINNNYGMMCVLTCFIQDLNENYYSRQRVHILMFNITDYNSFKQLQIFKNKLNFETPIFVIGTHKDLIENNEKNRQVTSEMVLQFLKELFSNKQSNIIEPWYFEVNNIEENNFNYILEEMIRQSVFKETHTNWNRIVWKILNGECVEKYVTDVRVDDFELNNDYCNIL